MDNLKVGDRVICSGSYYDVYVDGRKGTIVEVKCSTYGIAFDESFNGNLHNCNGNCKNGYGYYVPISQVNLLKSGKEIPVDKHLILQDSCGNFVAIKNSEKEAIEYAKSYNKEDLTIYKLIEVAKISTERKVSRVKSKKKDGRSNKHK